MITWTNIINRIGLRLLTTAFLISPFPLFTFHFSLFTSSSSLFTFHFSLFTSSAQSLQQMGGVYYAYPMTETVLADAPEGYEPFYISHYGRHGSRWLPNDERYIWVNKQFEDKKNLTKLGKSVRRRLSKVWKNAEGNGGKLTPLGARQHRAIARRMYQNFPRLFAPDARITAHSSVVGRCRSSMLAFLDELNTINSIGTIGTTATIATTDSADMAWIAYKSPEQRAFENSPLSSPASHLSSSRFISALFKDASHLSQADKDKLLTELHTIASDMQDVELDISLYDIFTDEEMHAVYDLNNRRMTLQNGDLIENEGIPARSAISLWQRIEADADAAIANNSLGADLRFGHDTNLYRLLTLMGVDLKSGVRSGEKGVRSQESGVSRYDRMDEILPMAANLQMIFYRRSSNSPSSSLPSPDSCLLSPDSCLLSPDSCLPSPDSCLPSPDSILVQLLLNERPVSITNLTPHSSLLTPHSSCLLSPDSCLLTPPSSLLSWSSLKSHVAARIHHFEHLRQLCSLNTMVGTAPANTKSAGIFGKGSEEHGQTLPAVLTPNGQNFWTPQTRDTENKCVAPYYYTDSLFQGIRNSHWIVGGCTQDYGSFTVAALTGPLRLLPEERATPFSHADEISHPHYYAVRLPQEHLKIELTGSSHAAIIRITPEQDGPVHIVIHPNSDEGKGFIAVDTLRHLVHGYNPVHRIYQGWGESAGFSGHFVLESLKGDSPHCEISGSYAVMTFDGHANSPIELRAASSFTSCEGALRNLSAETDGHTFESLMASAASAWIARLHTIDVEDPDTARVNQFYGALYRCSFLPREFSDVDGSYPAFSSGTIHSPLTPRSALPLGSSNNVQCSMFNVQCYYSDFSMWDTYRALHPLYTLIAPQEAGDMMQSLVTMYEEGGWLPIFPCWNSYTAAMIGDHCSAALADAYIKGVRNFDYEKAYEAMRKNAFETPASFDDYKNGMGRRALTSYLKYGYIPLEDPVAEAFHQGEQTSRTLEYAFDDFAVAQMAKALGKTADYDVLMRRSGNWRNVINPLTGYCDARHVSGTFHTPHSTLHTPHSSLHTPHSSLFTFHSSLFTSRQPWLTESAPCHYTWYVPHDVEGLVSYLGGAQKFEAKLDSLFDNNLYWHGNEPCHQIAYLYDFIGRRDKTIQRVAHILDTEYNDTPGGLSGNDDAGQMSAWYVFASMGFYPVCPATDRYMLAAPRFRRVTLNLQNGHRFVITPNSFPTDRNYITHAELTQ